MTAPSSASSARHAPGANLSSPARARRPVALTRGRRLALAIGVPVTVGVIGVIALNGVAQASQGSAAVRYAIPVTAGKVTTSTGGGNLTLRQASAGASSAELTATAHWSLIRGRITRHGSSLSYACPLPIGTCGLTSSLSVPSGTAVSASTDGGDLQIPGPVAGPLNLSTDGGDLNASAIRGTLRATSDGGSITIGSLAAPTAAVSSDGGDVSVRMAQAPGSLQISSDGGNVALTLPAGQYRVAVSSDGGNVTNTVGNNPSAPDTIRISSDGGDVTISQAH